MNQNSVMTKIFNLEKEIDRLLDEMVDFGQKWVGKNLQDCIPEISKDFSDISIKRENVTFVEYHPRRTKNPRWTVEKNRCRLSTYEIDADTILCDEFNTIIKSVSLGNCILHDENNSPFSAYTLHFELDDSMEYLYECY